MNIIETSTGLNDRQIFNITQGKEVQKLKDNDGRQFDIVEYIIYEDADAKTGEMRELLAFMTDDGDIIGTNSPTVIKTFRAMKEQFKLPFTDIKIVSDVSKNGQTFYDIALV